jgi:N-acetylglutamate synthase-like GNAT family acetyltransferase
MIRATETTSGSITIRDARPEEAAFLSALALRSKAHWGYSQEFIRSCEKELTFQSKQIADDKHYFSVGELDSVIAGFYALESISTQQFELEALFVEPNHIGKGIGRGMLQHALNVVAARSGESVLIQGEPNAEKFYLAAGAKQIGTRESGSIPGRTLPLFEILIQS